MWNQKKKMSEHNFEKLRSFSMNRWPQNVEQNWLVIHIMRYIIKRYVQNNQYPKLEYVISNI